MLRTAQQLAAELSGTFLIVFFAAGSLCAGPLLKGSAGPLLGTTGSALVYGLAVAMAVEVLGPVSGGHLNPAISLGAWATRRISTPRFAGYVAAQLLGAVLGAMLLVAVIPASAWQAAGLGTPVLAPAVTRAQGMGLEAILTCAVSFVFFRSTANAGKPSGWAVGAAVAASVLIASPLTGAALNPARAIAPAFVFNHWANQGIWWVGPLGGGVLGAWLSQLLS